MRRFKPVDTLKEAESSRSVISRLSFGTDKELFVGQFFIIAVENSRLSSHPTRQNTPLFNPNKDVELENFGVEAEPN
ncbi:hypothetical protein J6590_010857 [Homalodisca vitripennis]|nr:hypothetical protein J6590_010857 [Homalodisca vitripennis]